MRLLRTVVAGLASLLLLGAAGFAASVTGSVKGPDGAPFEGAFVQAQNSKTRVLTSVLSNAQGQYRIDNLPAGEYRLQIHAPGFRAEAKSGVSLAADQNFSADFGLQKAMLRWNEISEYQGEKLVPDNPAKKTLFTTCMACHSFQTRMASVGRDKDGWRDRVDYMRDAMHFFLDDRVNDQMADGLASYLATLWGPDATLPKSPTDMPNYKETVRPFTSAAMNIVYVEYDMPGPSRMPWSAAPDKNEKYWWIPYYGRANKIGRLDPKTAEVTEYPVPNEGTAAIHSVQEAPDGSVWLTEQGSNKLGRWDPATQKITEYQDAMMPGKEGVAAGSKHTLRFDHDGNIWASGGPFSFFDVKTHKFTDFHEVPNAYGVAVDAEGNGWFTYIATGQIGVVNDKTKKLTLYTPPTHGPTFTRRIQVDDRGLVWFAEFNAGKIASFDPKTEQFHEYQLPGPEPTPYALQLDKDHNVWYSSEHMDVIGRLDPNTGNVLEYPIPQSENTMREFFYDKEGRMWFGSPANNKVGYFYLAGSTERASK